MYDWEIKNEWNDECIQQYKDYVSAQIEAYKASGVEFTCEDLALSLLIDFAAANNLPVKITNRNGFLGSKKTYDAASKSFNSVEEFKNAVMSTTGANDLMYNTVPVSNGGIGDMILLDTGIAGATLNGKMEHTQIVIGFNFVSAQIRIAQGNTKKHGSDNPQSKLYIGTIIQFGNYYLMSGIYQRDGNPPVSNAFTSYGAVYRQWDFFSMN